MQSIKNTAVSIILLFLSYGVYQVITKPLPSELESGQFEPLQISDPIQTGIPKDLVEDMQNPIGQDRVDDSDVIPRKLLAQDFGDPPNAEATDFSSLDGPSAEQRYEMPDEDFAPTLTDTVPKNEFPVSQVSSFESTAQGYTPSASGTPDNLGTITNQHLDSDSTIIPTTLMTPITKNSTSPESAEPSAPKTLAESWHDIDQLVQTGKLQQALQQLTTFYRENSYSSDEQKQLMDWLDALAAKVIYSTEHHLRSLPYIIQPEDTIGSLARQWQVPAQLIYNVNVNQIPDPNDLQAGVEIKLIQGPFDAEIDTQKSTMTLYLGSLYAGRFNVSASMLQSGDFRIVDKSAQDHLDRPYWISLSNGASIFASDAKPNAENEIGLNLREAEEVFSILSATSKIKVLR